MDKFGNITTLSIVFFVMANSLHAYNSDHGLFDKDDNIKQLQMHRLPLAVTESRDDYTSMRGERDGNTLFVYIEPEGISVELRKGEATLLSESPVNDLSFQQGVEAYTADLNRDGMTDYLVYSSSGGCGLASGYSNVGFILSSGSAYELTVISTMFPDEQDFVVIDNQPCFIGTSFSGVEECRDGKTHNFWTYNILAIDGFGLRLRNQILSEFPKTIWYSFSRTHTETILISDDHKGGLVKASQEKLFWSRRRSE